MPAVLEIPQRFRTRLKRCSTKGHWGLITHVSGRVEE